MSLDLACALNACSPTTAPPSAPSASPRPAARSASSTFTRAYRPQTNGKAERFIRSALREWAYGIPYHQSSGRTAMLARWSHHYNWHRPHYGIGGVAPMGHLAQTRNNLLTLHSNRSSE